jgi:hypothetical protein
MMKSNVRSVAVLAILCAMTQIANAQTPYIDPSQISQFAGTDPNTEGVTSSIGGEISQRGCVTGGGCGENFTDVGLVSGVSTVWAQAMISGGDPADTGAFGVSEASVLYYFEVTGPAGTTVPLNLFALQRSFAEGALAPGGSWNAYTDVQLFETNTSNSWDWRSCAGTAYGCLATIGTTSPDTPVNFTFDADVNVEYRISLSAGAQQYEPGSSDSAFIDPTVSFASGAPPVGDALYFSPDLVGSVPEPSSSLLLIVGGLALVCRRIRIN